MVVEKKGQVALEYLCLETYRELVDGIFRCLEFGRDNCDDGDVGVECGEQKVSRSGLARVDFSESKCISSDPVIGVVSAEIVQEK